MWVWVGREGDGTVVGVEVEGVDDGCEDEGLRTGIRGVRDLVIAWTPWKVPARTR